MISNDKVDQRHCSRSGIRPRRVGSEAEQRRERRRARPTRRTRSGESPAKDGDGAGAGSPPGSSTTRCATTSTRSRPRSRHSPPRSAGGETITRSLRSAGSRSPHHHWAPGPPVVAVAVGRRGSPAAAAGTGRVEADSVATGLSRSAPGYEVGRGSTTVSASRRRSATVVGCWRARCDAAVPDQGRGFRRTSCHGCAQQNMGMSHGVAVRIY